MFWVVCVFTGFLTKEAIEAEILKVHRGGHFCQFYCIFGSKYLKKTSIKDFLITVSGKSTFNDEGTICAIVHFVVMFEEITFNL